MDDGVQPPAARLYREWGELAAAAAAAIDGRDWEAFRKIAECARTAFNAATESAPPQQAGEEAAAAAAAWEGLQPALATWKAEIAGELETTRKRGRTGQALQKAYGGAAPAAGLQIDTKN